jgi:hypothetical protein
VVQGVQCGAGVRAPAQRRAFVRWPDRVGEVLAYDEQRAWLLLGDAGTPLAEYGNPPGAWLEVLPPYADLQRGEAVYANDHIAHGVPSLPVSTLPARYAELLEHDLPLEPDELARLRAFSPRFEQLCAELAASGVPATVQHDDLHMGNVYELNERLRLLDWGDSSISHPFFSLVVTFAFSNSAPACGGTIDGLRYCATHTWSPGVTVKEACSISPSVSAASRTR